MSVKDNKIRVASSIPSLENKIHTSIGNDTDSIFWYIRFNIPLDEKTVSQKTMDVTDTDGYIMRTDINYNDENNTIIISPLDSYEQNRYYLLNITKKVKSKKGQPLKWKIHILFKLINNQISEYKILKKEVAVPKPRPRPRDYEQKNSISKVYSFESKIPEGFPQDKLPMDDFKINILFGIMGLALLIGSLFIGQLIIIIGSMLVCLAGTGYILYQLRKPEIRATICYNKGARQFNKEKYTQAEISFKRALIHDPDNEMAEYAINKVSFYKVPDEETNVLNVRVNKKKM